MRLHTVFVTHDRLELTKIAVSSYLETVSIPYTYVVVDNCSQDGTREWLIEEGHPCIMLDRNYYPGYACNRGWERAPSEADFLHRSDNDFRYLPGWCDRVLEAFSDRRVGQVGLRTAAEELYCPTNVGGNNVIVRTLWDLGLRYDERPWTEYPPRMTEDSYFSSAVRALGWRWTRVRRPCIVPISTESPDDPYYQRSWAARRIYQS